MTARRKEKKWTCADCGKAHKERSAVRGKGGGYICLEGCGLVQGRRAHKKQRPLARGRLVSDRYISYACAAGGVSK